MRSVDLRMPPEETARAPGPNQKSKINNQQSLEAVIFDLGSTLIYFKGEWPEVLRQSDLQLLKHLQTAGIQLDGEAFLAEFRSHLEAYYAERDTEFIEHTTAHYLRTLLAKWGYPEVSETLISRALQAMYAVSQARWQPEADAIPTLEILRQQGYRLGLISNASDDADVQTLVDKARLRPYFEVILSSAAQGIRKPNPLIFHTVLDRLGVPPGLAVMVGDSLGADILGAHNAGMRAIWITRRADTSANRAHEDTIQPDGIISTLSELPALLSDGFHQLAASSP